MKPYKLFIFYKRFCKEREKTLLWSTVNENKKTGLCFMTSCFLKPFKIIISNFCRQNVHRLLIREVCST